MEDIEYIKKFSKITITGICKDLKINRSNLLNEKTTKENNKKVKKEIEKRLKEIYND